VIQPWDGGGKIPIPDSDGLFVDSGWFGTMMVETEGTNEGLADLQDRCGPGVFPQRAGVKHRRGGEEEEKDRKRVFRILRERR
jgi:hypothetical protein